MKLSGSVSALIFLVNSQLMSSEARQSFLLNVVCLQNYFALVLCSRTLVELKNTTPAGPDSQHTPHIVLQPHEQNSDNNV